MSLTRALGGVAAALLCACGDPQAGPTADAGSPEAHEIEAIPDLPFPAFTEADLAVDEQTGVTLVTEHLLVGFNAGAVDADVAAALRDEPAEVVGGLPEGGMVLLRYPGAASAELAAATTRLSARPGVSGAARIGRIHANLAPASSDRARAPYWSWSAEAWPVPAATGADAVKVNGTWALRAISAPQAWNLLPWLQARVDPPPAPVVGVIDVGLFSHPDVVFDKVVRNHTVAAGIGSHGLSVLGTIGGIWGNGRFTDGVAPEVSLIAVDERTATDGASSEAMVTEAEYFAGAIGLLRATRRPRVINISMGRGFEVECHGDYRCDPRGPPEGRDDGPRAPDIRCDAAAERARTVSLAIMFAQFSARLQATAPVLFVQSAGNSSGPPYDPGVRETLGCPDDVRVEGTETYCQLKARGCSPRTGLGGHLPAGLSSPLAAAATLPGFTDVLIVSAAAPAASSRDAWSLAEFSDSSGQLVAPGQQIVVPSVDTATPGLERTVSVIDGTSFSAPLAAGVAAYLVSIDPTLTNAELIAALTGFTTGGPVAGDTTSARLDMMDAVLAIDEARPGHTPKYGSLLADIDDGTPDGFTREVPVNGELRPYTGQRDVTRDAGKLDMADFRALRDVYLMQNQGVALACNAATPACDLNRDGLAAPPAQEPFPRAKLVGAQSPKIDLNSVEFLAARPAFSDPVQGWRGADLRSLVRSADLIIEPDAFMAAAGADELLITLEGTAFAEDPQMVRAEPLTAIAITGETVLTTPLRKSPRITVRPVRRGVADERFLMAEFDPLEPGEDRRLALNPCAWTGGEVLLAPVGEQCVDPDQQLPDPDQVYFWIRFDGPDAPSRTYVMETRPEDDTIFTAYEPWNDRTFIHAGGWWRGHRDVTLGATMEWLGNGAGRFEVGSFHEGPGLPTGLAFSADDPFDAPPPLLNQNVYSVDVSIVVTQAGVVGGEDLVGTFSGEGAFSDGEVSLLPVHVEGGFRAKKHADVDAPR